MLPNREGRFKANILEQGLAETGPNHLASFICRFNLLQELVNGQWVEVEEDLAIDGYFYLEKKDGSINTISIEQLKSALGWDGRDPLWLADTDLSSLVVQVKLEFESYQGKQRIKVKYIDAEDASAGGVPRADENTRRSLSDRLGSKLRALAGGSPAPAPKPAGKPAAPRKSATMQQAWDAFKAACGEGANPQQLEGEWFRILRKLYPNRQVQSLSGAEWAAFIERMAAEILPF